MARRTATLGFVAIFLLTILCAVICPGAEAHGSNHVCDKPDHSCCPKSHNDSAQTQCVETHFVGASKYQHSSPHVSAFTLDSAATIAIPNPVFASVETFQSVTKPP